MPKRTDHVPGIVLLSSYVLVTTRSSQPHSLSLFSAASQNNLIFIGAQCQPASLKPILSPPFFADYSSRPQ